MYAKIFTVKKGNEKTGADAVVNIMEALILFHLSEGYYLKEIGVRLFIDHSTVKMHVRHLYDKTGVERRSAAALIGWLAKHGIYEAIRAEAAKGKRGI